MRIRLSSEKADKTNFEKALRERLPLVRKSCLRLHAMLSIEPGTKMLGPWPVRPHDFPEPPRIEMSAVDVVAQWIAETDARRDRKSAEEASARAVKGLRGVNRLNDVKTTAAPQDNPFRIFTDSPLEMHAQALPDFSGPLLETGQMEQQKRRRSSSLQAQLQPQSFLKKPRILAPLPEESEGPVSSLHLPSSSSAVLSSPAESRESTKENNKYLQYLTVLPHHPPERQPQHTSSIIAPCPITIDRATPPPIHEGPELTLEAMQNGKHKHLPIYWNPGLSQKITRWLEEPRVRSAQALLRSVELRSHVPVLMGSAALSETRLSYEAQEYRKIKLIRMVVPPAQGKEQAGPSDWVVLVVVHEDDDCDKTDVGESDAGDEESGDDEQDEAGLPYFLLAFPAQAVTAVRRDVLKRRDGDTAKSQQVTIVFGLREQVPLMHGVGVEERFCEGFLQACAQGQGSIRMASDEEVPL